MGKVIGIDLGTTYSAVTIPENRAGVPGFLVSPECQSVSVILDDRKNQITPSVVAEDEKSQILVGYAAKSRVGLQPAPIMFSKRYMGTAKTFPLGKQGEIGPEEVAKHVLVYLKKLAERRLGEPVERAVITVPAFFDNTAKQLTGKAAELAGLKVAQILQEPVAAALTYCSNDSRESMTILTYDLGGGTFDAAIVEKRDGIISNDSVKAFDGDRFLGGFNFDTMLAEWLQKELCDRGYQLNLDLQNRAGDQAIFAKLLLYAEQAKIGLSKRESYEFQEMSTGIVDQAGEAVNIQFAIERPQFEAMISEKVEYTLSLCERALEHAYPQLDPAARRAKLDEIVMVGGSSRIPLVARRLQETYGKKPRLVNPDLCVALGAGLVAASQGDVTGVLTLNHIPTETDMPTLAVTGQVTPGPGLAAVARCTVKLESGDGAYGKARQVGAEGRFAMENVPLVPESQNDFVLTVTSPEGAQVAKHAFSVRQRAALAGNLMDIPGRGLNVLAKPVGIVHEGGVHVVAPERTPLPFEVMVPASTTDTSGQIRIPIQEGVTPLGEILMTDIPETLPVGSRVEIHVLIQEDFQIHARGYVPALALEKTVTVKLPVRPIKTIGELRREFELLKEKAEDAIASAGTSARLGDSRVRHLTGRIGDCEKMLRAEQEGRSSDPAAIQDCLDEILSLTEAIREKRWKPQPSRDVFEATIGGARTALKDAIAKKPEFEKDGYGKQIDALEAEGNEAYRNQNDADWKDRNRRANELKERIENLIPPPPQPPPDPARLKLQLGTLLEQVVQSAKSDGRWDEFKADFDKQRAELERIDPKAPDALQRLIDWYNGSFQVLLKKLEGKGVDTKGTGITRIDLGSGAQR